MPRSTALERRQEALFADVEKAVNLPAGSIRLTGLVLDPNLTFEEWTGIGQMLGLNRRWLPFAIGDWLLFGEQKFGQDAAQAVEGTLDERYDVAQRTTGLAPKTLLNYVRIAREIPFKRRRIELDAACHEPVASLAPAEQDAWLQKAVDGGWNRDRLRDEIRAVRLGAPSPAAPGPETGPDPIVVLPARSRSENVWDAARAIATTAQQQTDGWYLVPPEPMARLREHLEVDL